MKKSNRGITLIALVITIVVMLVLVGIVITLTIGNNGIIKRAQEAVENHAKSEIKQEIELALFEIEMDIKSSRTQDNLSKQLIIEHLPKKLDNIVINQDMTGQYRQYDYWIDEEYKVHVKDVSKNPISVKIVITDIGISTCTIKVEASSEKGNIVGYQYKVNHQDTGWINQDEYKIENLEPDTTYTISISVMDEKENKKEENQIITTKQRIYIIKDGVEQETGNLKNAILSKENGYLKLDINSTNERAGYYFNYDLSKYKKIKIDTEVINKENSTSGCHIWTIITKNDPQTEVAIKEMQITSDIETVKTRGIYEIDVEDLIGTYVISYGKNGTAESVKASTKIYNIWLEE